MGTNSVAQNRARSASLNHIVDRGGVITGAVSSQPWPGEAVVEVAIVNWVKEPDPLPERFILDEQEVEGIDTAVRDSTVPIADVPVLPANKGRAYQGFLPGAHYDLTLPAGELLLAEPGAHYDEVVKSYLTSKDIASAVDLRPARFIVDFGQMALEEAMQYPAPLQLVREQAKQARETSTSHGRNPRWWQFLWPRPDFRRAGSAFETFPWPQPADLQRERIARLSRDLLDLRSMLCREHAVGLTVLYNRLDEGAYSALRAVHRDLDLAVLAACEWSSALLDDPRRRNRALLDLNTAILAGEVRYSPF